MTSDTPQRALGILGCGNIFDRYVAGLARFPELRLIRVADVDSDRAVTAGEANGLRYGSPEDLYADPDVEIVINLTPPRFHAATTIAALDAGKHVYVEKPVAASLAEVTAIREAATRAGRVVASAPDTFLGSAVQTARHAIDTGRIGRVFGASAFVRHGQVESWHPDPGFLFAPGGGPVMDMGPYYLANLIALLGPVETVQATTRRVLDERIITAPDRRVDRVPVSVDTHAAGFMTFATGAIATLQMSFDIWHTELPYLEVYGTEGTLALPNPNHFDGPVRLRTHTDADWRALTPVIGQFGEVGSKQQFERGLGVADLAASLDGAPLRTDLDFAVHVLDALEAFDRASTSGAAVTLTTTTERPAARVAVKN